MGDQTIPSNEFRNLITLRHLRIIAALADLKLVARVSESLNVTQPAVSKQIAELEKIVGAPVVTRDRNRLYLTPIGHRLADHAKQVLSQIDRASFDVDAMASGVSGSVSIGAVSSVAPTLLPKTIELFKRGAPHASVSITEGHFVELLPLLESGTLDLVIARIWQPQELSGIDQMTLFSEPVVIVVSGRDHPLTMQENLSWSDTIQFPWIFPQAKFSCAARRRCAFCCEWFGAAQQYDCFGFAGIEPGTVSRNASFGVHAAASCASSQHPGRRFSVATGYSRYAVRSSLLLARRQYGAEWNPISFSQMPSTNHRRIENHSFWLRFSAHTSLLQANLFHYHNKMQSLGGLMCQ